MFHVKHSYVWLAFALLRLPFARESYGNEIRNIRKEPSLV